MGDLWPKTGVPGYAGNYSSPSQHGFDHWIQTEAEASNSMPNCGCFPVDHADPGPKPPSGYPSITPHGDQCVVGGGVRSDWCYPCTAYWQPNASDPRGVSAWPDKVPGNDATFIVDRFLDFLDKDVLLDKGSSSSSNNSTAGFYAHLTFHAIHEPHPAMPEFYELYQNDPDYLGALTMFDVELGRLLAELKARGLYNNTVIFYTADNGPHQGRERSDIHYSTQFLRQCKASIFEGGIRVPGIMHAPGLISRFANVTTPTVTSDFLPTIMELLGVTTDNPGWVMDGMSLLPYITPTEAGSSLSRRPRPNPIGVKWGGSEAIIDNDWKLMSKPNAGQCDYQEPWASVPAKELDDYYLFNLGDDYHELHDRKADQPERYQAMMQTLTTFKASVLNSQQNESGCGK